MQTTLRLDDDLYREAKARAANLGVSLTRFLEDAIRERLSAPRRPEGEGPIRLPVSTAADGLLPGFSRLDEAVEAANLDLDRLQTR